MGAMNGMRALVTGGASGIGLATARRMHAEGAHVAVLDQAPSEAHEPAGMPSVRADISSDASVRAALDSAIEQLGVLDVLVNNAGIGAQGGIEDNPDEEWQRVFDVNVVGLVRVTRAALPALRASRSAAIINTCSVAATVGLPERVLYSASKGAVAALTRAMAADLLPEGYPGECSQPRDGGFPVGSGGCSSGPPILRPSGPRWKCASRTAAWSPRTR
jgi:2-keto-3-deoxy-L-fuconate dehydrogenase